MLGRLRAIDSGRFTSTFARRPDPRFPDTDRPRIGIVQCRRLRIERRGGRRRCRVGSCRRSRLRRGIIECCGLRVECLGRRRFSLAGRLLLGATASRCSSWLRHMWIRRMRIRLSGRMFRTPVDSVDGGNRPSGRLRGFGRLLLEEHGGRDLVRSRGFRQPRRSLGRPVPVVLDRRCCRRPGIVSSHSFRLDPFDGLGRHLLFRLSELLGIRTRFSTASSDCVRRRAAHRTGRVRRRVGARKFGSE